jgi:ferredoxin-type protein NapH
MATVKTQAPAKRVQPILQARRMQRVRKGLLLFFFLLFPVVLNFLSPYLSLSGALEGTISGSLLFFGLLLASSLLLGRAFCGWVCPGGAVQEICFAVNDRRLYHPWAAGTSGLPASGRRVRGPRVDWIKYLIWVPWLGLIVFGLVRAASAGGLAVRPRYMMDSWVSIDRPAQFITYYFVLALIVVPSLIVGRRTMCHSICWMAPFMILGRCFRNLGRWPALRLQADRERCTACGTCTRACPMSLPVQEMVEAGRMERAECILCGSCVSSCPNSVIRYRFAAGR